MIGPHHLHHPQFTQESVLPRKATGVTHVVRRGHDPFGKRHEVDGVVEFSADHPVPMVGDMVDEMTTLVGGHPDDDQLGQTAKHSADRICPRSFPSRTDDASNGHARAGDDIHNPSPLGIRIERLTTGFGRAPDAAALATVPRIGVTEASWREASSVRTGRRTTVVVSHADTLPTRV